MTKRVSRRRYAEVVKCLKAAAKHDRVPWPLKIRACELLMALFGDLPDKGQRDERSVKQLVSERSFEREVQKEVRNNVLEKVAQEAEQNAKAFLENIRKEKDGTGTLTA